MESNLQTAAAELKKLDIRRQAVKGIRIRLRILEADAACVGGILPERISGGRKRKKSGRVGTVEERESLQRQEKALQSWIDHTEQTLSQMHKDDRKILRVFYCENRKSGDAVKLLMEELHVSQSEIYRMRDRALAEFSERVGYF